MPFLAPFNFLTQSTQRKCEKLAYGIDADLLLFRIRPYQIGGVCVG